MYKLILPLMFLLALCGGAGLAQNNVPIAAMTQPEKRSDLTQDFNEFSLVFPNETWRVLNRTGEVEVIYGDRLDGFLQIRKVAVAEGATLADIIDLEITQKLQFKPGFVQGKEENFKGVLSGKASNYEYTQSGKPMIGRVYFLETGDRSVYVLRFTGSRDKLRMIRNQTDAIARGFKVKK